jgi:hypothetical protein
LFYFLLSADEHGAIGQDAIHIAQEQPDALERRIEGREPPRGLPAFDS